MSRSKKVVALSLPPFFRFCCIFSAIVFLPFLFFSRLVVDPSPEKGLHKGVSSRLSGKKNRLAIVIPFIGEGPEAVPPYLELFCSAAAGSAALVDFLLIHSGVLDGYYGSSCPDNVKFISLSSLEEFSRYMVRVVDHKPESEIALGKSRKRLAKIVATHIIKYPYVLVEFKPALGHVFAEFLHGYSHWGYSDLDILFGDLERWITPDELNDFDIVTYGFGDQDRIYLRGQFTFHKNNEKVNQLWRSCHYLSDMDKRFNDVLTGAKHLHFESAEGCYSAAVLEHTDIKVKYAVKAFTDIHVTDTAYSHGLYVATGKKKTKTVLYKAGSSATGKALENIPDTWFEMKDSIYADPNKPLMYEVGERERIPAIEKPDAKCMFWAPKEYQSRLCLDNVKSTDTVFWIDGQLYKQRYEISPLPGGIVSAPFFHFQEYKRYFRSTQLSGFHRSGPVRSFVLTKEGLLPMYPEEYNVDKSFVASPLGLKLRKWNGVKGGDRRQLPHQSYCLRSGPRKFPPNPPAPQCQFSTSWQDSATVEVLSGAPSWRHVDVQTDVTMILTLQLLPYHAANMEALQGILQLIGTYLDRWRGQPSVILIHVPTATDAAMNMFRMKLVRGSDLSLFDMDSCFVAAIFSKSHDFLSRKALLNMAIDVSPTRWYVSGFELERGLEISHDAAFFAHRAAAIHQEMNGSVLVMPQFGLAKIDSDFTLPALWNARKQGAIKELGKLDDDGCEAGEGPESNGSDSLNALDGCWWERSEGYMTGSSMERIEDDSVHEERAETLDRIQTSLVELLTEAKQFSLFAMDHSPITLVDNMGPHVGMKTNEIAREVEEFGGKQCYNGLRLAQLATFGYSVGVLSGAFALSTPSTRKLVAKDPSGETPPMGSSRCDGCFLFDEKHEDILEDISEDERKRPAKASLLWHGPLESDLLFGHM